MYEKNGGDLLWGDAQSSGLAERVQKANFMYGVTNTSEEVTGSTMPEDWFKE